MDIIKYRRYDLFYRERVAAIPPRSTVYENNNEEQTHNLKRERRTLRIDRSKLDQPFLQQERSTTTHVAAIRKAKTFKLNAYPSRCAKYRI